MNFKATTQVSSKASVVAAKIKQAVRVSIEQGCNVVLEEAKALVPVRTGDLRDSGASSVAEEEGKIVGTVAFTSPHAAFVEYGTGIRGASGPNRGEGITYSPTWPGMVGTAYLRPAVDIATPQIKDLVIQNVRAALK